MPRFSLSVIVLVLAYSALGQQSQNKSFEADLLVTKKDGQTTRSHFYSANGNTRIERSGKEGVFLVVIEKNYGNTLIYLSPGSKSYFTLENPSKRHASVQAPSLLVMGYEMPNVNTWASKPSEPEPRRNGFLGTTRMVPSLPPAGLMTA